MYLIFLWWMCVMQNFKRSERNGQIDWTDHHSNTCSVFYLWPSENFNLHQTVWYKTTYNVTTILQYYWTSLTYFPSMEYNTLCTLLSPRAKPNFPHLIHFWSNHRRRFSRVSVPKLTYKRTTGTLENPLLWLLQKLIKWGKFVLHGVRRVYIECCIPLMGSM